MVPFEFMVPYTLDEAVSLLDAEDPGIRPVSGGTAIMLMMKAGVLSPTRLVSLHHLDAAHAAVRTNAAGELVIGAMTRLATLEHDAAVNQGWPLLARTMRTLSNVRVRAVATVGGALAHADPHMDLPPVLAALGARITIVGPKGTRSVSADDLATGYYETVLARDELISEITVPPQQGPGAYMKVTTRAAHDWPALGLAIVLARQGDAPHSASIVVGAATDKPTRLFKAQAELQGSSFDDAALKRAGDAAADEIDIVSDPHGSAAYKRHLLRINLGRAVRTALGREAATAGSHA
jgi:carbon-monoxide dehydrogenase medium subunit